MPTPIRPPLIRRLEIVAACLVIPLALEILSATRVLETIRNLPARRRGRMRPAVIARYVDALLTRLPGVWRHTCLRRAAVLAALLRRQGDRADVIIGVRRVTNPDVAAHAWVRCNGIEPYLDQSGTAEFTPLSSSFMINE